MISTYQKGNVIQNALIILVAGLFSGVIQSAVDKITVDEMANFLVIISMLLVTVCFANFAFTYERARLSTIGGRVLAHAATSSFMLLIALLLETIVLSVRVVYPSFHDLILGFTVLLYVGLVLYDIWDLQRAELK